MNCAVSKQSRDFLWMKLCDLLAPRQYIVSDLFTSSKGVEEITTRKGEMVIL